ncbi:SMI1/KNR4 family protein [Corallincola holothuriorum]|uniref:SMI1/KNR4 family protein n=1 Tax=Corallincola holothuriorum TaxID=2282215 RepID=A0A368NKZ2_9GAMM|nr:SMI1/KNR4 family protein [Corallincola holothuriorum]
MAFDLEEKYLAQFELQLGFKLPSSYRAAMAINNGGELVVGEEDWQLFPILDQSDRKRIARTCNHVLRETNEAREWHDFPDNAVAIASNGCGDLLIFLVANESLSSEVYEWSHETRELTMVSKDFSDLERL